jgi:cystathionine beta-lyase
MAVRLRQHQETTFAVATWLAARDDVASVLYPALPESPDHALWRRDFTGACGLMAFELATKSADCAAAIVDRLRLFGIGSSWGGYESLAIAADPAAYRTATRWQGRGALIRLHVGLEDPADLIADLDTAMEAG